MGIYPLEKLTGESNSLMAFCTYSSFVFVI